MDIRTPVFCGIVPPHILDRLARADDPAVSGPARRTLQADAAQRTGRRLTTVLGAAARAVAAPADGPRRTVYDARGGTDLPGVRARGEGAAAVRDATVNRAY
ncbi:metalloprotease, partial [Streptomyces pristinaespiralis ATCC 25486]